MYTFSVDDFKSGQHSNNLTVISRAAHIWSILVNAAILILFCTTLHLITSQKGFSISAITIASCITAWSLLGGVAELLGSRIASLVHLALFIPVQLAYIYAWLVVIGKISIFPSYYDQCEYEASTGMFNCVRNFYPDFGWGTVMAALVTVQVLVFQFGTFYYHLKCHYLRAFAGQAPSSAAYRSQPYESNYPVQQRISSRASGSVIEP